jgi:hypothetical protein
LLSAVTAPMLTTIFFDAGNTLVFANLERTLAALHVRGIRPKPEQLHAAERQAKTELPGTTPTGITGTVTTVSC